ncbi:class I SAM-dependent methyltransferase [Halalkalibacter urbisdiaboli]|uniref:class I SAM-dependent methyltransferase n=1 Tax=Halalkalibacter urbisdiaboli TaxID=1960589 RepID=UPI000B442DD9|nr:class I SAM-dependent methyltransferase [Halalkalibacter urbisdiaboli]
MNDKKIEQLYTYLNESAILLEKEGSITYLEALAEVGENLFHQEVVQEVKEEVKNELRTNLEKLELESYESEVIRKAFQLTVLKGMKESIQPHHAMTPDAVCLFVSYLVDKVIGKSDQGFSILDLAVGSGNLLSALINQSSSAAKGYGFEVDETLLHLAFVNANLQKHEIELFHKDSIQPIELPKVDLVVTDVPVGYYPHNDVANQYTLHANEGHSYIHHLMIEKGIQSVKDSGFLIFIVPNFLFQSDQAATLHAYLKEQTCIHGLLQLPKTMFKSEQHAKSILILQKRGEGVQQPRQALLAELPSFEKKEALADMIQQINKWFKEELNLL